MKIEHLLPLGAAAAQLGVHPSALRRAAENGDVPYVRLGGVALLFDVEAVRRLLLKQAQAIPGESR